MAMHKVAPSILKPSQIAAYAATEVQRKLLGRKVPAYKPVFTECLDHFLIHAGEPASSVLVWPQHTPTLEEQSSVCNALLCTA